MAVWRAGGRATSEGDLGGGTTVRQVASSLGAGFEPTFEVSRFEPGRPIRSENAGCTAPIRVTLDVEQALDGSVVTATIEGEARGLSSLTAPVLDRIADRRKAGDHAA